MAANSIILDYIKAHPKTWEEDLNGKLIRTSHDGSRVCFKYATGADFSDPIVCEARGIIIDIDTMDVVCRPFDKFFNVQEQYAADIDWNTARVLEKIDGSLIKLYWYDGQWVFATSSTCDARSATVDGYKNISYYDVIVKADNYREIPFDELDNGCTYMFELLSPLTQVVIRYDRANLYYLTKRNNRTGEEIDGELVSFKRPKKYPLKTLDECLKAAARLNGDNDGITKDEGFVVVDGNHQRVKIKSPAYIAQHRVAGNKVFTAKRMAELFCSGADFGMIARDFPNDAHVIKYYDWQFEEVKHKTREIVSYARALYEEYDHDRAAVAKVIRGSPYAWAGFAALDGDRSSEDIMKLINPSKLEKLIREYEVTADGI